MKDVGMGKFGKVFSRLGPDQRLVVWGTGGFEVQSHR
jgi:hypothetical protein